MGRLPLFISPPLTPRQWSWRIGRCWRHLLWHTSYDVRRGGDVAVAQPLLDQLHLHALRDQERRTGVASTACVILLCS